APNFAEIYVPLPIAINKVPRIKAINWKKNVSGLGISQLNKSINIPMKIILANVPTLGNSRKPMEAIVITIIPIIIDQSPTLKPYCLNKPTCSTSQEPTPKHWPLIVNETPQPRIIRQIKKKVQRITISLLNLFPHKPILTFTQYISV